MKTLLFLLPFLASLFSSKALASSRKLGLFWDKDVDLIPSSSSTLRISTSEIVWAPANLSCLFQVNTLPLAILAIEGGAQCAFATGAMHTVALGFLPEISFRKSSDLKTVVRPAIATSFVGSFHLNGSFSNTSVFGAVRYKLAPKESADAEGKLVEPGFSPAQLQKWHDLFESSLQVGGIWRNEDNRENAETLALEVSYFQSLPLELRRLGLLEFSAAIAFKGVEAELRSAFGRWSFGAGGGYLILSVDRIRLSFPYPELSVAYTF